MKGNGWPGSTARGRQYRVDFTLKEGGQLLLLAGGQLVIGDEPHAFLAQSGKYLLQQGLRLALHHRMYMPRNQPDLMFRGPAVNRQVCYAGRLLPFQPSDAFEEKFIEIAAGDGDEFEPFPAAGFGG